MHFVKFVYELYVTNKWNNNNNTQFKKFFISGVLYSWIKKKNVMFKIIHIP